MSICYTFIYYDNNNKPQISSIPNPTFNKDLRETASRKHLFNLPASEMMTRLIKVCNFEISQESVKKLDQALYFGPFGPNSTKTRDHGVYNSNLDEISSIMQEFSTSSDVYFGWSNYFVCSLSDIEYYIKNKSQRQVKKLPEYSELLETDIYLKEKVAIYEIHKNYNYWLSWIPFGYHGRAEQEKIAKQVVDDYVKGKKDENDKAIKDQKEYEKDLDNFLIDLKSKVKALPEKSRNISLLLKVVP